MAEAGRSPRKPEPTAAAAPQETGEATENLTPVWQSVVSALDAMATLKASLGDVNHRTLQMRVEEVERAVLLDLAALRDSDRCQIAVVGTSAVQQADFLNQLLAAELQAVVNDGKLQDQTTEKDEVAFSRTDATRMSAPTGIKSMPSALDLFNLFEPRCEGDEKSLPSQSDVFALALGGGELKPSGATAEQRERVKQELQAQQGGLLPRLSDWNVTTHISYSDTFSITLRYKPMEEVYDSINEVRQMVRAIGRVDSASADAAELVAEMTKHLNPIKLQIALAACGLDAQRDLTSVHPSELVIARRFSSIFAVGHTTVRSASFPFSAAAPLDTLRKMGQYLLRHCAGTWAPWSLVDAVRIQLPLPLLASGIELLHVGGSLECPTSAIVAQETNQTILQHVDGIILVQSASTAASSTYLRWLHDQGVFDALYWSHKTIKLAMVQLDGSVMTSMQLSSVKQPEMEACARWTVQDFIADDVQTLAESQSRGLLVSLGVMCGTERRARALRKLMDTISPLVRMEQLLLSPLAADRMTKRSEKIRRMLQLLTERQPVVRLSVIHAVGTVYTGVVRTSLMDDALATLRRQYGTVATETIQQINDQNTDLSALFDAFCKDAAQREHSNMLGEKVFMPLFTSQVLQVAAMVQEVADFFVAAEVAPTAPIDTAICEDMIDFVVSTAAGIFADHDEQPNSVVALADLDDDVQRFLHEVRSSLRIVAHRTTQTSLIPLRSLMRSNFVRLARQYFVDLVTKLSVVAQQPRDSSDDLNKAMLACVSEHLPMALDRFAVDVGNYTLHAVDRFFEGDLKLTLGYAAEEMIYRYCVALDHILAKCPPVLPVPAPGLFQPIFNRLGRLLPDVQ